VKDNLTLQSLNLIEETSPGLAMAPAMTIENDSDFNPPSSSTKFSSSQARTLLLAPPSIASHEEKLRNVLALHDRAFTDLQMLDRLAAGLVTLPPSTYDLVLILTDADGTRKESTQLLSRELFSKMVQALKAGGKLQAQDGAFGHNSGSVEYTEAILAGLVAGGAEGMVKPESSASEAVPLRFGKKKDKSSAVSDAGPAVPTATIPLNGKRKSVDITQKSKPAGVGFVDFSDDFGDPMITGEEDDDDELIDEDTLLTEEDLKRPVVVRKYNLLVYFAMLD
jgi:anamorsin